MAATQAIEGYGTILSTSTDGVTYTQRAEIRKIDQPGIEPKSLNASNLLSPGGWDEFLPGMIDAGEFTCEANWIKTEFNALLGLIGTVIWLKITFTTGSTFVCKGFITKQGQMIDMDDVIKMPVTFKLTGQPTFTP